MKNLRTNLNNWLNKLNERWCALPVKKQHRYTLLLFAGYALLSVTVILKACYDVGKPHNVITIEHIENPIIKQNRSAVSPLDSITTILKNSMYGK